MKEIQIIRIKNEDLYYLNQIIEWNYSWWGIRDGRKKEEVREYFEHCLNTNYKLPQTFGAFLDGKIVGMYCISMVDDLESRPDIYPWLINVFVDPDYRNQGIGKALLESVDENARKANLQELYLYTKHIGFYEKFGWEFVEEVHTFREDSPVERLYYKRIKSN